ncbi:hypothetical protein KC19_3G007800 [Ceratodon purpureus]|uniref:Uncharacterized protein n=1 Tax=Ceratodon purpureus TaxID=3225 RepID=A0A8T0IFV1_CERPU|nr:hypothetical protein KC19_3G007800 [Ceratodon purpureus]
MCCRQAGSTHQFSQALHLSYSLSTAFSTPVSHSSVSCSHPHPFFCLRAPTPVTCRCVSLRAFLQLTNLTHTGVLCVVRCGAWRPAWRYSSDCDLGRSARGPGS